MEVKQVLHMKAGEGEKSYTQNSSLQNKVQATAKKVVEQAVLELYLSSHGENNNNNDNTTKKMVIRIADLGCAVGPNAWKVVTDVVDAVVTKCHELDLCLPEFQIFLNDLPSNDFNTVFRSLPGTFRHDKVQCYIAGVPGSFYERLFPNRSIDFFHSSTSIHWLSQVPMELQGEDGAGLNNDKICISPSSPQVVIDAFGVQFQRDFEKFLRCRSEELVANGRMVLVLMGRRGGAGAEAEPYHIPMDLLGQALNDMAAEGLVEKEKIMTFNIAYYSPSAEEVMDVVAREGSFSIKFMDFFDIDMVEYQNQRSSTNDGAYEHHLGVRKHARSVRAVFESLLETLVHEDLIDDLFTRYEKIVHKYCLQKKVLMVNLIVTLEKKPNVVYGYSGLSLRVTSDMKLLNMFRSSS